ncbi:MAG: hypothetical protein ACFFAS_18520 [Promethearchaeota archaeon]
MDFFNNISINRSLYSTKKKNLIDYFKSIDEGRKALRIRELVDSDDYLRDLYRVMDLSPRMNEYIQNFIENLTYINFQELEQWNYLTLLFIEMDEYFYKCFKYILTKRPEILENKQISIKEIRELKDIELIFENIVDKYISDITYKGTINLFKKARKPIGINHSIEDNLIHKLDGYREVRNIYVHKKGKIDGKFKKKLENLNLKLEDLGIDVLEDKIKISEDLIFRIQDFILEILLKFDSTLVDIYKELITKT